MLLFAVINHQPAQIFSLIFNREDKLDIIAHTKRIVAALIIKSCWKRHKNRIYKNAIETWLRRYYCLTNLIVSFENGKII